MSMVKVTNFTTRLTPLCQQSFNVVNMWVKPITQVFSRELQKGVWAMWAMGYMGNGVRGMSHMGKGGPWMICSQNIKKMSSCQKDDAVLTVLTRSSDHIKATWVAFSAPLTRPGLAFPRLCMGKSIQWTAYLGQLIVKKTYSGWAKVRGHWQLRALRIEHTNKEIHPFKLALISCWRCQHQ